MMVISRTPYRISFFGGGTDYPSWYLNNNGGVLSTTIDKYCYMSCRSLPPFFRHRFRIAYSKIEECESIDQIQHPAAREVLRFLGIKEGVEVHHDGDLPARSGMGSSSAFTVGLLNALYGMQGKMVGKLRLALESIRIEQDMIGETVGCQDQVSAAYGGFNHIEFLADGRVEVHPVILPVCRTEELNSHLMLFFTGIFRVASRIAESYAVSVADVEREKRLQVMAGMVQEAKALLTGKWSVKEFGRLLHEAWQIKRGLSDKVTSGPIDDIYSVARKNGAIGGKLLGAGGGGFMLLLVPPDKHGALREALSELLCVPARMEYAGSQVIYYDPGQTHFG